MARHKEDAQSYEASEKILQRAMDIAPTTRQYENNPSLQGLEPAYLKAASHLASFYQVHAPVIDPDGDSFNALEQELFDEKNKAYLSANLHAMEQFHTTLGLIYAEKDRWDLDSMFAAPYHLEQAVETAINRSNRSREEYQPHPNLTEMLADGLSKKNIATSEELEELYYQASLGYLGSELPSLEKSESVLQKSIDAAIEGDRQPSAQVKELEQLFDNYQRFDQEWHATLSDETTPAPYFRISRDIEGVYDGFQDLDKRFIERQKAKLTFQVGNDLFQSGRTNKGVRFQVKSFETLQREKIMTYGDFHRYRTKNNQQPHKKMQSAIENWTIDKPFIDEISKAASRDSLQNHQIIRID